LGEALPFMLPRLEKMGQALLPVQPGVDKNMRPATKLQRSLGDYLRQNVYYTIAGFNFMAPFLTLLLEIGAERIMFAADYPYGSMIEAHTFLNQIPVSPADHRLKPLNEHIDAFAHLYNHNRPHDTLGGKTPNEYLNQATY
jgi:predicted TIM-barrel fold metal-dependent hydrolase